MNCFILCLVLCFLVFILTLIFAKRINEKINNLIIKIKSKTNIVCEQVKAHFKANKIIYIIVLVLAVFTAALISYCVRR